MEQDFLAGYDREFMLYATEWVAEEIAKCTSAEEFAAVPQTILTKLKNHITECDRFLNITHVADEATEEEKFQAAKRYEDHLITACAITWAMLHHEIEENSPPDVQDE